MSSLLNQSQAGLDFALLLFVGVGLVSALCHYFLLIRQGRGSWYVHGRCWTQVVLAFLGLATLMRPDSSSPPLTADVFLPLMGAVWFFANLMLWPQVLDLTYYDRRDKVCSWLFIAHCVASAQVLGAATVAALLTRDLVASWLWPVLVGGYYLLLVLVLLCAAWAYVLSYKLWPHNWWVYAPYWMFYGGPGSPWLPDESKDEE